jgi:5,10-methylenetetrahydromethanopterin reductase
MRIGMMVGGEVIGRPGSPAETVHDVRRAEDEGFAGAWAVHFSRATDALTTLAVAGTVTSRIDLGVGVVPTYPRHPLALAQQTATAQAFCGGRLTLGVGVSHRPVIEGLHGLAYTEPAEHLREYLTVLVPLLRGEEVSFDGRHHRVHGGFRVPGAAPVSVLVGALSERGVRAAGELADGVVTWLAGPRTLGERIVPALTGAAAGRPAPRVVAALPVAVTDDPAAARRAAQDVFGRYGALENYRRVLEREGVDSVGDLVVAGAEAVVTREVERLAAIGVTELWAVPFPCGADPDPAGDATVRRTRALLAGLGSP